MLGVASAAVVRSNDGTLRSPPLQITCSTRASSFSAAACWTRASLDAGCLESAVEFTALGIVSQSKAVDAEAVSAVACGYTRHVASCQSVSSQLLVSDDCERHCISPCRLGRWFRVVARELKRPPCRKFGGKVISEYSYLGPLPHASFRFYQVFGETLLLYIAFGLCGYEVRGRSVFRFCVERSVALTGAGQRSNACLTNLTYR